MRTLNIGEPINEESLELFTFLLLLLPVSAVIRAQHVA